MRKRTKPWRYLIVLFHLLVGAFFCLWAVGWADYFPKWLALAFLVLILASGFMGFVGWMATTRELRCPKCHWVFRSVKGHCQHCAVQLRPDSGTKPFQFSLRGLLLFVLIVGVFLSLIGRRLEREWHDRGILAELSDFHPHAMWKGGRVVYLSFGAPIAQGSYLSLGTPIGDDELPTLVGLTSLTSLDLKGARVTDAGLEHLEGIANLESLELTGTQVTEEGVEKLQEALPNCKILH
jgi:hypothetical protein